VPLDRLLMGDPRSADSTDIPTAVKASTSERFMAAVNSGTAIVTPAEFVRELSIQRERNSS
jgi:hypothetical protein